MTVLLTRRAVVQAAMETVYGDATAVTDADGMLIENPMFDITPNVLERSFARDTLSMLPFIIGRKIAKCKFSTELRGNGKENSGIATDAPIISRLFRACGMQLLAKPDATHLGVFAIGAPTNQIVWAESAGAKATGTVTITTNPADADTVTIGGKVYTFQTALTNVDGHVLIGATVNDTALNLKNAINAAPSTGQGTTFAAATVANTKVTATVATDIVTVTAINPGTGGNAITLATSNAVDITLSGATLTGGVAEHSAPDVIAYYLEVTVGGASGVAKITVTSDTVGENTAEAIVTSGTPFTFGTHGASYTPTFTGNLTQGDRYMLWLLPSGIMLKPVSDNFESVHISMNKDGVLHSIPGALGTFSITAEAGQYAKIEWEFTGIYVAPVDFPIPKTVQYERTLPQQVELARLRLDNFNPVVAKYTFNIANDIQIRPDVNSADGYIGVRLVARKPEGGVDPEADLVANYDFWGRMASATRMPLQIRIGTALGNAVWLFHPLTQYNKMTYADRNGIETYDAGLQFSGYDTDDEVFVYFK